LKQIAARITCELARLPESQRVAFELIKQDGLSVAEAADVLGISVSAVKLRARDPVWLAAGPPEGSTSTYRITMFWGGWDPDGEIKKYQYRVTNNVGIFNPADTVGMPWHDVIGNDSTFTFSADHEVDTLNVICY
jgi:hypothetical protein